MVPFEKFSLEVKGFETLTFFLHSCIGEPIGNAMNISKPGPSCSLTIMKKGLEIFFNPKKHRKLRFLKIFCTTHGEGLFPSKLKTC